MQKTIALFACLALPSCLTVEVHLPDDLANASGEPRAESGAASASVAEAGSAPLETITVSAAYFLESAPISLSGAHLGQGVLLDMGHDPDFERIKAFMADADGTFWFVSPQGDRVEGQVGIGGYSSNDHNFAFWRPDRGVEAVRDLEGWSLEARNREGNRDWTVSEDVVLGGA